MQVKVFYAKAGNPYRFMADRDFIPNPSEIEILWEQVAELDSPDILTPDDVFGMMNYAPEDLFDRSAYERGVQHTSMSVGDIVTLDNAGYVCLPSGWHTFGVG